jgi:hypothetical protein
MARFASQSSIPRRWPLLRRPAASPLATSARGPLAAFRERPRPVHKYEPRPTAGLPICYLAFALAAVAALAEGSAKAITASPSRAGAYNGLPPKP